MIIRKKYNNKISQNISTHYIYLQQDKNSIYQELKLKHK